MPKPLPKPLLYTPPPKKLVWVAFGCTAVIYVGAVVAAIKREAPPVDLSDVPTATVIATLEQAEEQPTPPPEDIPLPPPPPEPQIQPEFHEESTPPPRQQNAKAAPIKVQQATGASSMSLSAAKAAAIFAPKPQYPYEARSRHVVGSGIVKMSVAPGGSVTDASIVQSTGSPILDQSAVSAYRQWRFKPGTPPTVKGPFTFTMTGVSY
jgi:TonB family protein